MLIWADNIDGDEDDHYQGEYIAFHIIKCSSSAVKYEMKLCSKFF